MISGIVSFLEEFSVIVGFLLFSPTFRLGKCRKFWDIVILSTFSSSGDSYHSDIVRFLEKSAGIAGFKLFSNSPTLYGTRLFLSFCNLLQ